MPSTPLVLKASTGAQEFAGKGQDEGERGEYDAGDLDGRRGGARPMRRRSWALRVMIDQFEKATVSGSGKPSKLLVSLADPTSCLLRAFHSSSELSEILAMAISKSAGPCAGSGRAGVSHGWTAGCMC